MEKKFSQVYKRYLTITVIPANLFKIKRKNITWTLNIHSLELELQSVFLRSSRQFEKMCEKSSEPQLTTSWSGLLMLTADGKASLRKTLSVSKGLKGNKAAKVWLIGKQLNYSTLNRQTERMGVNFILPKVSNWDLQLQVWDWEALWGLQLQKDKE